MRKVKMADSRSELDDKDSLKGFRFFNDFQKRVFGKAISRNLEVTGVPQSVLVGKEAACLGFVLRDCSEEKCASQAVKIQKKFERLARGDSIVDQAKVAAEMSGAAASPAEFVESKKTGSVIMKQTKGFTEEASFISIFNGRKAGQHAIGIKVTGKKDEMGNNQCEVHDPNAGKITGECPNVMKWVSDLQIEEYDIQGPSALARLGRR